MWHFSCRSSLFAVALLLMTLTASAQAPGPDGLWWSSDLVRHLAETGWEPPYFKETVRSYQDGYHHGLALRALDRPTETITVGNTVYRTSPALIGAGREIFYNYHFGTHLYWDFRRAIDWSTGITDPAEYSRIYGVQRDKEGYFVGMVGIQEGGRTTYGHSCALCHAGVDDSGSVVDGMANHDYDIGLYYDALRPKIRDVDVIYLGDSALEVLRYQGPGRTDSTVDSSWAPVRVPHLYALKGFTHGLRSNGDMANLWIQCYRNLNGSYAVDSEIMEALMAYLLSLKPPANPRTRGPLEQRGEAVFKSQRCHRCHIPPYYSSGQVIDWETIRTDADRIRNGHPKGYKVASLLRVDQYRFLLHDGSLTSLEQLFDPDRLLPRFIPPGIPEARGKRGVPGHPFGLRLSQEDRAALVAYLKTL